MSHKDFFCCVMFLGGLFVNMYKYVQLSWVRKQWQGDDWNNKPWDYVGKKQEAERELIYSQGLELFKTCLERVNALTVEGEWGWERREKALGESERLWSESSVQQSDQSNGCLHSYPRNSKNVVMGVDCCLLEKSQGTALWEELLLHKLKLTKAVGDGGVRSWAWCHSPQP